jgi:hypothetical protein
VKDKDEEINVGCGKNYHYKPSKYEIVKGAVVGSFTLLAVVAFLLFGFLLPGGIGWTTAGSSSYLFPSSRRFSPVFIASGYSLRPSGPSGGRLFVLGMGFNLWHPLDYLFSHTDLLFSLRPYRQAPSPSPHRKRH